MKIITCFSRAVHSVKLISLVLFFVYDPIACSQVIVGIFPSRNNLLCITGSLNVATINIIFFNKVVLKLYLADPQRLF